MAVDRHASTPPVWNPDNKLETTPASLPGSQATVLLARDRVWGESPDWRVRWPSSPVDRGKDA